MLVCFCLYGHVFLLHGAVGEDTKASGCRGYRHHGNDVVSSHPCCGSERKGATAALSGWTARCTGGLGWKSPGRPNAWRRMIGRRELWHHLPSVPLSRSLEGFSEWWFLLETMWKCSLVINCQNVLTHVLKCRNGGDYGCNEHLDIA